MVKLESAYYAVLAHFWQIFLCQVVALVTFSSNLSNFARNNNPPPKKNLKKKKCKKKSKKSIKYTFKKIA